MSFKTIFIIQLLFTLNVSAEEIKGKVTRIIDGDTIVILTDKKIQKTIRLKSLDSPERKQAYGGKSKRYLSSLIANKKVIVKYRKKDRYKRIIGTIIYQNIDVNLAMIKAGLSWHYKHYQKEQTPENRKKYSAADKLSKINKIGLFADPHAIPPWKYRKQRRQKKSK